MRRARTTAILLALALLASALVALFPLQVDTARRRTALPLHRPHPRPWRQRPDLGRGLPGPRRRRSAAGRDATARRGAGRALIPRPGLSVAVVGPLADAFALDQRVSSEKARRELGWMPNITSVSRHADILLAQ